MVLGFLLSEAIEIACVTIKGAVSIVRYFFSTEQKEVNVNMKLIQQVQDLEKMCVDISEQRAKDIKQFEESIDELKKAYSQKAP